MFRFNYTETDDEFAYMDDLRFEDVIGIIEEHNRYFGTNYQTIQEFNNGEECRQFDVYLKQVNLI